LLEYILSFVIGIVVLTVCLWLGMTITRVKGTFVGLLITVVVGALLGLIPLVGKYLTIVALFVGINKFTDAEFWPDAILMVIVSWIIYFVVMFFVISAIF